MPFEGENREMEKAEADKQQVALDQAKQKMKMSHERELLEQQLQFQKALETGQHRRRKRCQQNFQNFLLRSSTGNVSTAYPFGTSSLQRSTPLIFLPSRNSHI